MAIKVNNVTVIDDSRNATVVNASTNSLTYSGTNVLATAAEINQLDGVTDNVQSQLDGSAAVVGTLDRTFTSGETVSLTLSESVPTPIVSVIKEVPQTGVTSNDWDVASDGANYTLHDTAYDTTLTPSNATGNGAFTLGTGSFASEDVGKRIVGNGGEAILTAADGSYELQTAFNDSSTIAAGDWSMFALDVESADAGLTLSGINPLYDLETTSYSGNSFSLSGQSVTFPTGIIFNNDGTKMYVSATDSDAIYQYSLTTAFDLSSASYDSVSLSTTSQESLPTGISFNNDGTKFYITGTGTDTVYQYSVTTPYDLSSASYDGISFGVSNQTSTPFSLKFNPDGTKLFISSGFNNEVLQYSLSNAFDLSTASSEFELLVEDDTQTALDAYGIEFNNDGSEMYVLDGSGLIYKFNLIAPYDISTSSFVSQVADISSEASNTYSFAFDNIGAVFFVTDRDTDSVYQYSTGRFVAPTSANHTAITTTSTNTEFWTDINSMTADDSVNDGAVYYAVSTDDRTTWSIIDDTNGVRNIARNNAGTWEVNDASDYGTETWVAATTNDEFYALEEAVDVSTAQSVIGFAPADQWSYSGNSFSVTSEDGTPQQVFFKPDGLKMFVLGAANDSVYEYNISTAWDVSTASYTNKSFDVSAQESSPGGLFFKPDGTKMFVSGFVGESLNEYTLSTPWDISTASYNNSSFSLTSQDGSPAGIFFKPDGSRFYFIGGSNDNVFQYNLSTPWDVSTVSYSGIAFDISSQDTSASGLTFKPDGTKMYIAGEINDKIHEYELSTDWDISTASYTNKSFDVSPQDSKPLGISFKPDGTKLFLVGDGNNLILDYDTTKNTSVNRMDATQLNAVSDANHYTLGNDLDLAITLFMADGNTNSPTSDGVSINYDANVLNQGAVLGTDYEFDAPAGDTVRITALSDENFKVKVI